MLKAENGATMETDLEETRAGWVARYSDQGWVLIAKSAKLLGYIRQGELVPIQ